MKHFARQLERWARQPAMRWLFFTGLAAMAALPWIRNAGGFNDFRDAQTLWLYEDSARRSVIDFGQLPLWNPDYCGGLPGLGTPQSRFASPTFLLTLLFGTTRAEPLVVFSMVLVALFGAHRYARRRGASQIGATLAAPIFGLMGVFACAPFLGWFGFLGFALLPWVLAGLRDVARGKPGGAVSVALGTAFIVGFGGTYVGPITLVACVLELGLWIAQTRRRPALGLLFATGLVTIGLSAFRLWPVWEELRRGPRVIAGLSALDIQALGGSLFGTYPVLTNETWYLVTIPGAVVAGFALLRRRARWLALSLVLWLWLAVGNAVKISLYAALRAIPVFSLLRNSERFLVPAALVIATGAAWAITDAWARWRLKKASRFTTPLWVLSVIGTSLAIPWLLNNFFLAEAKRSLTAPPREVHQAFHQARGNRWSAASFGPASRGSLACWEAYAVPQSSLLRPDLEQEASLADPSSGTLVAKEWTPQRLEFQVELRQPGRVLVNQNYHRGWKANAGTVVDDHGLLAVELPAGTHSLQLRFLPVSAVGGIATSLVALLVLALWMSRNWSIQQRLLLSGTPALAFLVALATSSEPPLRPNDPVAPDGETILAAHPPPDATPLGVRFESADVTLEAASVRRVGEAGPVRIELDWSRGPKVNPRLGFFVHVEPGTLKRITADHLQVSDGYYLEQLPIGQVGRDIMEIDVPENRRGQPWNVWVGLWEMRGNGDRIPITDAHGVTIGENRVLAGTIQVP